MGARAYVLIKTAPGLTKAIYSALCVSPAVASVEIVTGPYDLIACLEADTTNEILTAILRDVRPADGIRDTVTCLVVPTEGLE
jgi:DNA-binding Lrp family transcriptional regulator